MINTNLILMLNNIKLKWDELKGKFLRIEFMNGKNKMGINMLNYSQYEVNTTTNWSL